MNSEEPSKIKEAYSACDLDAQRIVIEAMSPTFEASKLNWNLAEIQRHKQFLALYRDLIHLRKSLKIVKRIHTEDQKYGSTSENFKKEYFQTGPLEGLRVWGGRI